MHLPRTILVTARVAIVALICTVPAVPSKATTGIILRSRYRIVLAADSRAVYGLNENATECKLFEGAGGYATVSGLAHYGRTYRVTDTIEKVSAAGERSKVTCRPLPSFSNAPWRSCWQIFKPAIPMSIDRNRVM